MGSCSPAHASLGRRRSTFPLMPCPGPVRTTQVFWKTHTLLKVPAWQREMNLRSSPSSAGIPHPQVWTGWKEMRDLSALCCPAPKLPVPADHTWAVSPANFPWAQRSRFPCTGDLQCPQWGRRTRESQKEQWGAPHGMLVRAEEAQGAAGPVGRALPRGPSGKGAEQPGPLPLPGPKPAQRFSFNWRAASLL